MFSNLVCLAAAHLVPAMEEADAAAEITAHRDTWANSSGALEYQVLGGAWFRASNLSVRGRYASAPTFGSGRGFSRLARKADACKWSGILIAVSPYLACTSRRISQRGRRPVVRIGRIGEASEDEPLSQRI